MKDLDYIINGDVLTFPGTDIKELGDLITNALSIFCKRTDKGEVALGPWLQLDSKYI